MKYMLMMNCLRGGYEEYMSWPAELLQANIAFMQQFTGKLAAAGELVGAEGLANCSEARRVYLGGDGKPVTDGVFPETKEFLAGYWIIDVPSTERALAIAAEAATAPGQGAHPLVIEVRQIMAGPPEI